MKFDKNQYVIKRLGDLETITITKEALESWRDQSDEMADAMGKGVEEVDVDKWYWGVYCGMAAVLTQILKHFEEEEL